MLNWWCKLPAILPESSSTSSVGTPSIKAGKSCPYVHGPIDRHRANPQGTSQTSFTTHCRVLPGHWGPLPAQPCASGNVLTWPRQGRHRVKESTAKWDIPMSTFMVNRALTWLGHSRIKPGLFEKKLPLAATSACVGVGSPDVQHSSRMAEPWKSLIEQGSAHRENAEDEGVAFLQRFSIQDVQKVTAPVQTKTNPAWGSSPTAAPGRAEPLPAHLARWRTLGVGLREIVPERKEGESRMPPLSAKANTNLCPKMSLAGSVEDTLSFEPLLGFLQQKSVAMLLQTCQDSGFLTDLCLPHCSYTTGTFGPSILWGCWSPWACCSLGRCSRGLEFLAEFCSVRQWLCGQRGLFNTNLTTSTESLCPSGSLFSFLPQLGSAEKRDPRLFPAWK